MPHTIHKTKADPKKIDEKAILVSLALVTAKVGELNAAIIAADPVTANGSLNFTRDRMKELQQLVINLHTVVIA